VSGWRAAHSIRSMNASEDLSCTCQRGRAHASPSPLNPPVACPFLSALLFMAACSLCVLLWSALQQAEGSPSCVCVCVCAYSPLARIMFFEQRACLHTVCLCLIDWRPILSGLNNTASPQQEAESRHLHACGL